MLAEPASERPPIPEDPARMSAPVPPLGDGEEPEATVPGQPRPPVESTAAPAPPRKPEAWKRSAVEWLVVVVVAVAVALLISATSIQAFFIPSKSMESTLHVGDRVLVNKWSYRIHDVHRGDVVVFSRPKNEPATNISDLIKRVIGLPGETVTIANNHVYINGHQLNEPYLDAGGGQRGRAGQVGLHPGRALQDPQGTALGHGRQPHRLRGQPLLRPHPRIVGGGPRLLPHLAAEPPGKPLMLARR